MGLKKTITVAVVICVLIILVFPMFTKTTKHKYPVYSRVKTKVGQIEQALRAIIMDNDGAIDVLPLNNDSQLTDSTYQIFVGNPPKDLGWRNTMYMEGENENIDHWGQQYWYRIEQKIPTNYISVKAWSSGPNKINDSGLKDDINSWEYNPRKWKLNKLINNCCED